MSDSLTAIYVEPHQCPLHQPILLTQGPICESFAKIFWELAILKNVVFLSRPFWILVFKKKEFTSFPWKLVKVYWLARMDQNFDQAKGDNNFWPIPNFWRGVYAWHQQTPQDLHTMTLTICPTCEIVCSTKISNVEAQRLSFANSWGRYARLILMFF